MAEKKEINVKMSILNAVYFPDKDYSELNNINYPVNTFRIVLNKYLDQQIPVLPPRYFLGNMTFPYKLIEVEKN